MTGKPVDALAQMVPELVVAHEGSVSINQPNVGLQVWDSVSGQRIQTGEAYGTIMAISPDNRIILTRVDRTLRFWDTETLQELRIIENIDAEYAAFSPYGTSLAVMTPEGFRLFRVARSSADLVRWVEENRTGWGPRRNSQ